MRRIFCAFLLVLFLPALCLPAYASRATLDRFFFEVETLQAIFTQRVVDETGMTLEESSGRFSLSRPGKFRWDYNPEDPELEGGQQIVANGEYIFMYDPDLEQLTQRNLKHALGQVPSLLLVQKGGDIDTYFTVVEFGMTDGLEWLALKPRDTDAAYQQLMLAFDGTSLRQIVLLDGLGNETKLVLSGVKENLELNQDIFEFVPPEGTDILFE